MLRAGGGHWVVWPAKDLSPDSTLAKHPQVTRHSPAHEWIIEQPQLALLGLVTGRSDSLSRRFENFLRDRT